MEHNTADDERKRKETIMQKEQYTHIVQYYETDQMKIVHHSNYIRWFEEARGFMLEQAGFGYDKMEQLGVIIPVLEVSCQYLSMVRYQEHVQIIPKLVKFNGIKMTVEYEVIDAKTKELRAKGRSVHCFLNRDYKPMSLKREQTEIYEMFLRLCEQ